MSCKVHNVRFYSPKPGAIQSLSVHKCETKLSVLRNDQIIEIWNLQAAPFVERTIMPDVLHSGIECIIWCGDRLFSCTRDGFVIEYDLNALSILKSATVTGGAAYCIDVSPVDSCLAIGTEKGYINIFSTKDNELLFSKFLDKQEGQIMCLKFDPSGKHIASGSIDTIRIWDVETGHALHRMTTGRAETNKMTIVWTIAITEDLTIISGDSRGKLTFWDGKAGAQIESYQSHKADLLTLCLSKDEKTLYCAGVDPNIMSYQNIQVKDQRNRWVKSIQRKVHDHDVKALVLIKNKLYSAGEDGYLACSYHPPKTLIKYAPIIKNPIEISSKNKLLLMKELFSLDIWTLGSKGDDNPQKLVTLTKTAKSKVKEAYNFACLSQDGQYIVCGTNVEAKIYKFSILDCLERKPLAVKAIKLPENLPLCNNGLFVTANELVLSPKKGGVLVLKINGEEAEVLQEIDTLKAIKDTITLMTASACGTYIVIADPKGNIAIYNRSKIGFAYYCNLPKYDAPPTAMSVNSATNNLVVAYSDAKLVEYNLKNQKFSASSKDLDIAHMKKALKNFPVQNIIFDSRNDNVIILQDDSNIITINKGSRKNKTKKAKLNNCQENTGECNLKIIKKYKHLVHLGWVQDEELVVVEVSPLSLSEHLPPCLEQNAFGTK